MSPRPAARALLAAVLGVAALAPARAQAQPRPRPPLAEQPRCPPDELSEALLDLFPPAPLEKRLEAARTLGACGGRRTIAPLAAALGHDPDLRGRVQTARVLDACPDPAAVTALRRAVTESQPRPLRIAALESLAELGDTEPAAAVLAESSD